MTTTHEVRRDESVSAKEIEGLRVAVGWEKFENKYDRILTNSYTHFTVRERDRLLAFVNVISDGIGDAFLVDLMVHPSFQRRGLGKALVEAAITELTADGIKCIQVTFNPEHEAFYRDCGFYIFRGGIIDNDHRETAIKGERPNTAAAGPLKSAAAERQTVRPHRTREVNHARD